MPGKSCLEFFDVLKSRAQSLSSFKKLYDCIYKLHFLHFIYETPNIPIAGLLMTYKTAADNSFFSRQGFIRLSLWQVRCGKTNEQTSLGVNSQVRTPGSALTVKTSRLTHCNSEVR